MAEFSQFHKDVDLSSRKDMIEFLRNHMRYDLMNSWNRATSYANNIKIYNLNISKEIREAFFEMLDTDIFDEARDILDDFRDRYDGRYQIGVNGRSGGYLVLYNGYKKDSEYKSYCTLCGQKNFKAATDTDCKCGRCGADARINFNRPIYQYGVTFKSIDQDADFEGWSDETLKQDVLLVQDFDATCDAYIERLAEIAGEYIVVEETVYVPETRRVLKRKSEEE